MPSPHDPTSAGRRPPLRPLVGLPERARERTWRATVISVLLHVAVVVALILPAYVAATLDAKSEGAGGAAPAGGGGGGQGGTGGLSAITERLHFLHVAPPPPPPKVEPAPVPTPVPPPVPPKKVEPPKPAVTPPPAAQPTPTPAAAAAAPLPGTGGGTGNDGTSGSGPGTGGGVGSGVGTGRGSGVGPGTGGGPGEISPPMVDQMPILPLPVPSKVRPYVMTAYFDVDERGNATLIAFNPSRDGGYNKRIRETLAELRFKPATRPDGTAVRDTAIIQAEVP